MPQPDANIKKIIVDPASLANMFTNANQDSYFIRYRITSDDGSLKSRWSNVQNISGTSVSTIQYDGITGYSIFSTGKSMTLLWKIPQELIGSEFDVYAKWYYASTDPDASEATWVHIGSTGAASISIDIPEPYQIVSTDATKRTSEVIFRVQRATFPKTLSLGPASLFQTSAISTRATTDGGRI